MPLAPITALPARWLAFGDAALTQAVPDEHRQVACCPAAAARTEAGELVPVLKQAGEGRKVDALAHGSTIIAWKAQAVSHVNLART